MKLVRKYSNRNDEFFCEITQELDKLCGFENSIYKNYLLDTRDLWDNCFAIRAPGRTTGSVEIDANNKIVNCSISSELIGDNCLYPKDTNDVLNKYVGITISEGEENE